MNKFTFVTKTEGTEAYVVKWTPVGYNSTFEIFRTQKEAIERYHEIKKAEKLSSIEIYYKRYIDPDIRYRDGSNVKSDMTGSEPKY